MPQYLFDLEAVVHKAGKLFTLPDICLRLRELIDEGGNADEIARLIHTDTALTARLLHIVNSALYALPAKIDSIDHAITLIGTKQLYELALATSAAATFKGAGGGYIDMKQFWRNSIYCGLFASLIYKQFVSSKDLERLFIVGILHNIGWLVMLEQVPDVAASALITANDRQYPWQREVEVTGFSCAELGAALLAEWNLPESIYIPIRYQHQPLQATTFLQEAIAIHVAVRYVNHFTQKPSGGANFIAAIDPRGLEILGLAIEWLEQQKPEIEVQAHKLMKIFA